MSSQPAMVTCPNCGQSVPEGNFCVRCGTDLSAGPARGRRTGYSAAPHEHRLLPHPISTLFPHLPRASVASFRVALAGGTVIVVGLAAAGLFPLAFVAAAALVPLLTVLYLYDVNLYEDEPLLVIGLTMLWGAATGLIVGLVAKTISPSDATLFTHSLASRLLLRGLLVPAVSVGLMLAGPVLVLLPYHKFNDVLDGATFGAASAVTFLGTQALAQGFRNLEAGFRPVGSVSPWVGRLLGVAVAGPLIAAGAVGAAAGAFWLRYRAPVPDRRSLGVLSMPVVGVAFALALVIGAAVVQLYVGVWPALGAQVALAAIALVALRRVIHIGLLEESLEVDIGPDIVCPNCGHPTPHHTFCINCGISLRALPKGRGGTSPAMGGSPAGDPA
ncbi:MAG TPA: zinc ribbon domain-containing protein [Actinomycetota bacterium]